MAQDKGDERRGKTHISNFITEFLYKLKQMLGGDKEGLTVGV